MFSPLARQRVAGGEGADFGADFEQLGGVVFSEERDAVREAIRRDQELSSGAVIGRTHEEVMLAARRAIGCA